ncbi:MAG: phosphopantothenoylcysteine decarboxylase [Candidatus Omnitrophota bacterium]
MATKHSLKNKKILITCGPTWIPIDKIRVISNQSSGELGDKVAAKLIREGAKVTMIQGPVTYVPTCRPNRLIKYNFYEELAKSIKRELKKKYDVVIHAAAVSDYQLKKTYSSKLDSGRRLHLDLVPTKKIITQIKKQNPKTMLVGFKLEANLKGRATLRKIDQLFKMAQCDLVVVNAIDRHRYQGLVVDRKKCILAKCENKKILASKLVKCIKSQL